MEKLFNFFLVAGERTVENKTNTPKYLVKKRKKPPPSKSPSVVLYTKYEY